MYCSPYSFLKSFDTSDSRSMCVARQAGRADSAALTMASAARTWPAPADTESTRSDFIRARSSEVLGMSCHGRRIQRLDPREISGHIAGGIKRRHDDHL